MLQLSNGAVYDSVSYSGGRPKKVKSAYDHPAAPKKRMFDFEKVVLDNGQLAYRGRPAKTKSEEAKDLAPLIPKRRSFDFEKTELENGQLAYRGRPAKGKDYDNGPLIPKHDYCWCQDSSQFFDSFTNSIYEAIYLHL